MTNKDNVTASKPEIGGAVHRAPIGTPLPTSATEKLNETFASLGYISEDGITNSNTMTTEKVKAWGGDVVLEDETEKTDTMKMKLIEGLNVDVLKAVYGDSNVSGSLEAGIIIKANSVPQEECCWVVDMVLKNALKRVVIPCGKVTSVGDVTYKAGQPVAYETTISTTPDSDGQTHYEYIVAAK